MAEVSADFKTLKRLKIAALVLFAIGAGVGARLFQFQIIQHDQLTARSEQQYYRTLRLEPKRGTIYDRNMKALAVSVPVSSLYANPEEISNPLAVATKLAPILGIPQEELTARLSLSKSFVWVQRKTTPAQAEKIAALDLRGLWFLKENKRYYPKRTLAAQLMGFVGTDNKGLEGLEFMYDQYMGGSPSLVLVEKDARGRKIYTSGRVLKEGAKGLDIKLNIDETVQYITEKELARQVTKSRARGGVAIVMDPYSGELLALAHQPSFNPNSFLDYRPARWKRSAVADTYEPGSTFKLVTLAAVLEEGLARPDEMIFTENGIMLLAGKAYHDVHSYRWLTMREVISKSSNIGTIKLGQRLRPDLMHHYVKIFGFGSKTGVGLPGEASGFIRGPQKWSKVSIGSVSIGYEVSVTPIQLITAYAAVANGGLLVQPRAVRGIVKDGQIVQELPGRLPQRVLSPKTAATITSIFQEAIENGTGRAAAVDGYAVAGKTGTAQKFDSQSGTYSTSKYVASFVGYLPAERPRVVILVLIDEPQGSFYGGVVAAPAFSRIASQVVRYLKIPSRRNLLSVASWDNRESEHIDEQTSRGLGPVIEQVSKGVKRLWDRAKSSLMSPLERSISGRDGKDP